MEPLIISFLGTVFFYPGLLSSDFSLPYTLILRLSPF